MEHVSAQINMQSSLPKYATNTSVYMSCVHCACGREGGGSTNYDVMALPHGMRTRGHQLDCPHSGTTDSVPGSLVIPCTPHSGRTGSRVPHTARSLSGVSAGAR